jgi:hypothetical protein
VTFELISPLNSVPEPSSILMFGSVCFVFISRRRN